MASTTIRRRKNSGANTPTRRRARKIEPPHLDSARASAAKLSAEDAGPQAVAADEIPVDADGAKLILGTPKSWIYAKAESGEIPSYKIGHYRRFLPSELREYLHKCRSAPRS